jgi:hypothetical protein
MLAIHLFAFFHDKDGNLPNTPAGKEKRCNPQRLQRFLKLIQFCRTFSFALFFDFRYLLCRSSNDTQALVTHAIKQSIKLPPLRGFLGVIIRKEKLVYRYVITGNEVIENLQARLLSFVLDIRKIARRNI